MVVAANNRVAVIGAGLMGRGIAHGLAAAGYEVGLADISKDALARARSEIESIFASGFKLGKISQEAVDAALGRLSTYTDARSAADGAILVVETVTEMLSLKHDIVRIVEPVLAPGAIIGSNTSALSLTEIAGAARDPSRVVGMHFFNPVHKMKLLELVMGLETSRETVAAARSFGEKMSKAVIVVSDAPGLTTSRMSAMIGNEAMHMLTEGTASAEDIDTALRLGFNHPMGPLELGDLTGWDTRLSVLKYLHSTLGEKFRPAPLIQRMVNAGRLGRKTGAGVYRYDSEGRRIPGSGLKGSVI